MKVAIIAGSDLRNYGGGEKDIIRYTSQLKDRMDITIFSLRSAETSALRVNTADIDKLLQGVNVVWYKGRKIRLLKDIWTRYKFDLRDYDKVYVACQGFLLNWKILKAGAKRTLMGIHTQSTLMNHPIENKAWKRLFYKLVYPVNIHYIRQFDEVRIQNRDDERRLREIGYHGKIWNVPPAMFKSTPEPTLSGTFYGVWVNRVSPEKRPELLVYLARLLPDIEFHAIGSGPRSNVLRGVPNIVYRGFVSEEDLEKELQFASFYVSTSRGENFGMSAVEALAHGVPAYALDVMGLRDYCTEVFENISEMAVRIRDIYDEFKAGAIFLKMRKGIRQRTLDRFADAKVIPQIERMLKS